MRTANALIAAATLVALSSNISRAAPVRGWAPLGASDAIVTVQAHEGKKLGGGQPKGGGAHSGGSARVEHGHHGGGGGAAVGAAIGLGVLGAAIAAGAAGAASPPPGDCWVERRPVYDDYGNYAGRRPVQVCE